MCSGFWGVSSAHAGESVGSIAIIDASIDVRPFIPLLKTKGVRVVGRYFARCKQPEISGVGRKRLVDNTAGPSKREVDAILDAGFGIVSVYQYLNKSPLKFDGMGQRTFTQAKYDVPVGAKPETVERTFILPGDNCAASAAEPNTAEKEGQRDAAAAVAQAKAVGQPGGSAIYFGVDFDTTNLSEATWKKMEAYFNTVRAILKKSNFRLGVYGDGGTLERLDRLVDFKWLLPSPGFNRVTEFYNEKGASRWHLFQNLVDAKWTAGTSTIELDGNVQSAATAGTDVGFWDRKGPYILDKGRTVDVFEKHRFICDGSARLYKTAKDDPANLAAPQACKDRFAVSRTVSVGRQSADLVEVDCDDDGTFDGWTKSAYLSKSFRDRPPYLRKSSDRAKQVCK